jgi:hypothetical protein
MRSIHLAIGTSLAPYERGLTTISSCLDFENPQRSSRTDKSHFRVHFFAVARLGSSRSAPPRRNGELRRTRRRRSYVT